MQDPLAASLLKQPWTQRNSIMVDIFSFWTLFDTATYVDIERDRKVTLEAQLGLIGGTMGLFTGFSILSAVEIIYYIVKVLMTPKQVKVGHLMVHYSSAK